MRQKPVFKHRKRNLMDYYCFLETVKDFYINVPVISLKSGIIIAIQIIKLSQDQCN